MAASKEAYGKLWCELLSSDKYRDAENYKENTSAHHLSILSPCSYSPCQNGGTCIPIYKYTSYQCLCEPGFMGEFCEKAITSCKELYDFNRFNVSELVTLRLDSKSVTILCHMGDFGCGNGGWTPVMKIDGKKSTFHYNSPYWSNKIEYKLPGGESGFDSQETKLSSYWNTSFSKICLVMKIGQHLGFTVINKQADSLYSLIADGQYRAISLGRETWKNLIGSDASLQLNCNREGFNTADVNPIDVFHSEARIGIVANQENDCKSCDSRIGFGTGGYFDDAVTCGNVAKIEGDNGDRHTPAMGYILVQ
ncbi:Basement membrane-specific heparan sulfate proteoglycan core protein [Stylophora pistillata]|uniref:Basement membrane-specific heparan sulfate proteoglycan core protein n=2 Tax=Stylophora pistillata TaxID=50429 RepID=A0A2B4S9R2_STYPI|nr:Basement membrane-specific heparan sulfate proteoglycan core protein [Stylophora pistillata]